MAGRRSTTADPAPRRSSVGFPRAHVVVAGEDFYDLAERYYGDPTDWRKIAAYNAISNPAGLVVGRQLVIPAP